MARMSNSLSQSSSSVVKHSRCPEWGRGLLIKEHDDKRFYEFEDGKSHVIGRAFWNLLEQVQMTEQEVDALENKLQLRRPRTTSKPKKAAPKKPVPTFEAQLTWFEQNFAGGFAGDEWLAQERGVATKKGKAFKNYAIATAQRELAAKELKSLLAAKDYAGIMTRVQTVLKAAGNLLHPLGDLIPFSKLPTERHETFATALVDLLHGTEAFELRFDAYVTVLAHDSLATWPLVTVLPALLAPDEYVFVKPSFFETQAAVLSFALGYQRTPSAQSYMRMLGLANELKTQLTSKALAPADLLDVYGFIARANAKTKAKAAKTA